jgi:hypothetical protein
MVELIYTDLYLRFNISVVFITNYFSVVTNIRYLDSGCYGYLLLQADENGTRARASQANDQLTSYAEEERETQLSKKTERRKHKEINK